MERYQEAIHVNGMEPGERDSSERWSAIAPHVPASGMILDIGSNLGFFGLRSTQLRPDVAVVSVEASASIAERQRQLLVEHQTSRICLVHGSLDAATAAEWAETCDWFELTLVLSVLHWMDDPGAVLRSLSSMSTKLIAEVPDVLDTGACGRLHLERWGSDPVAWFSEQTGRQCTLLARISRHTSAVPSHLVLVEGPTARRPSRPYWGYSFDRAEGDGYRVATDGHSVSLSVRGAPVDYRPGVNLLSLMRLGTLLYPPRAYWLETAEAALRSSPGHGDPYPHNMIWTPTGIALIDEDDLHVERSLELATASFRRNLRDWERGRTLRYVREVLGPRRLLRRMAGRAARRLLGDGVVERIKSGVARISGRHSDAPLHG